MNDDNDLKFSSRTKTRGYVTADLYYWICDTHDHKLRTKELLCTERGFKKGFGKPWSLDSYYIYHAYRYLNKTFIVILIE